MSEYPYTTSLARAKSFIKGVQLIAAISTKNCWKDAFTALLEQTEEVLSSNDEYGLLVPDREQNEEYIRLLLRHQDTTRQKNNRESRILETPFFKDSKFSYFIQLVDCVAYALLRQERPLPLKNAFGLDTVFTQLQSVVRSIIRL